MPSEIFDLTLPDEAATAGFAQSLAPLLGAGDTVALSGDIGAGKTAFARALIRAKLQRAEDVPSPTFTLVQTYQADDLEIWHCDLYRLGHPDEALELGLEAAFDDALCLIEWPDRLGDALPPVALTLHFTAGEEAHRVVAYGSGDWPARLAAR